MSLPMRTWGRGPREVVFLHGFTGGPSAFDHLEPWLGDVITARVLTVPGHEGSPLPDDSGARGFAQTVAAIAASLPSKKCPVVGYSQGARLALCLAVAHPEKVCRLVLEGVHPGLRRRFDRHQRQQEDEQRAEKLERLGLDAFLAEWERHPVLQGQLGLPAAMRDALAAQRRRHSAAGLAGALRTLGLAHQPDCWPVLHTLTVPTLLVTGETDAKFSQLAKRMVAELPWAWHAKLPGAGHSPHLEQPEAYAAEVASFLRAPFTHEIQAEEACHA